MDKREMIERALVSYLDKLDWNAFGLETADFFDALAEQAIAVECAVEQVSDVEIPPNKYTVISLRNMYTIPVNLSLRGHHGAPGKALAIIIPLEEE